jgi:hypothetical protein
MKSLDEIHEFIEVMKFRYLTDMIAFAHASGSCLWRLTKCACRPFFEYFKTGKNIGSAFQRDFARMV